MLTIIDATIGDATIGDATIDDATIDAAVIDDHEIDRLAWDVERTGLAGHEDVIARIVDRARPGGASPVLVDVLADPTEPENARVRAFGRVALQLGARRPLAA